MVNPLQAYARFTGTRAVLIVPNPENPAAESKFEITVPLEKLNFPPDGKVQFTDLITGKLMTETVSASGPVLKTAIPRNHLAIILVELK